jgi:arylsulfatase
MSDKWYAFEESIKVPLIIKDPRMPVAQQGTTNGEFTLSVDLAPTILSAANIEPPVVMQGRDIAPLYMKPEPAAAAWRKDFFYEWTQGVNGVAHDAGNVPAVFALIQKGWKYIYWPKYKYEQIYNYAKDPFEEQDIFNDTAQTNLQLLLGMRDRYEYLKNISQKGFPV